MSDIFPHVFHQRYGNSTVSLEVPGRVQQIHGTFASDSVQWCSVGDPSMVQWCSVHRMYPGNKRLMAIWDNVGTGFSSDWRLVNDTIFAWTRWPWVRCKICKKQIWHMPVYQSWTCMSFLVLETFLVIVPHTQAPDSLHSTAFDGQTIWPWSRWKIVPQVAKPTVAFRNSPDFLLLSILYVELPMKGQTLPIYV